MGALGKDKNAAGLALLSLTFVVIVRTAWISDQAVPTLRFAVNLINRVAPTLNVNERATTLVHPLWVLLIAVVTLVATNAYYAVFAVSIALSLATLWLLVWRVATSFWPAMLAGAVLILSRAYVDYSTSGFENPLSHFLLVYGVVLGFKSMSNGQHQRWTLAALTTLIALYLCRPELLLLVLPFCAVIVWQSHLNARRTTMLVLAAVSPVGLWTLLRLIGYPGIFADTPWLDVERAFSSATNIQQGINYLVDSFSVDPVTLTFVAIGILLALRQSLPLQALATGIVLYLLYVLVIGGDSWSGRLLTAPLLASVVVVSRSDLSSVGIASIALVLLAFGALSFPATIMAGRAYTASGAATHGIKDGRGEFFQQRGLLNAGRMTFVQPDDWTRKSGNK